MEERENRTRLLCQFLTDLTLERVGAENIRDIRYKTLDWLGCVIAAQTAPCAAPLARFTRAEGGAPRATAVGLGERTGAQSAASSATPWSMTTPIRSPSPTPARRSSPPPWRRRRAWMPALRPTPWGWRRAMRP